MQWDCVDGVKESGRYEWNPVLLLCFLVKIS